MDSDLKPILKWAGGKRQLLDEIIPMIKKKLRNDKTYYEPFVGGGAVLFSLQVHKAVINDFNKELINLYCVIKDEPEELLKELLKHENNEEYFYSVRKWDRESNYDDRSEVEKAARMIYLNKTCFNGLYRVNSKGQFNVPFGYYKKPNIADKKTIYSLNRYFNDNEVNLSTGDFEDVLDNIEAGDFVYFDPPYAPLSKTSSFTSYTKLSFNLKDQKRLRDTAVKLHKKGAYFVISNAYTEDILDLYKSEIFKVSIVKARRSINSNGKKRTKIKEVLISNYE